MIIVIIVMMIIMIMTIVIMIVIIHYLAFDLLMIEFHHFSCVVFRV